MSQWFLKITDYTERLLQDIDKLTGLARTCQAHAKKLDWQISRR